MALLNTTVVLASRNFPLQVVKRIKEPFDGLDWLFEIKHVGFRVLTIRDGHGATRLFTRNGYDISRRHRHLTEPLHALLQTDSFWTGSWWSSTMMADRISAS
jgi:ATP-dependent DNA ligase